ncbi:Protein piccolo [Collichthys lucidus]|uniref:Protein piccolo n=1 Tax=Collichthys lucidus TaxID=240159 RepID=A0A4U5VQE5_COLLU|nr:Protein piccolo [Collichthys lucidus]
MGNEASLEGGEGPPSGLPEGLAPDGKGGFVRVPEGTPVNLSELTEEERRQLAAAIPSESDAQHRPQQVGASKGPTGLSKSRTVDAFNQGPPGRPTPGRSPSSLSLFESRFRQEPKDPETKSGMFGSSFLSGANPLSAMTSSISSMGDSVNMPKFGLFGDEEGDTPESKQGGKPPGKGPQQGPGPKGPQQGGPQKQGQGPPGQGPKSGQGPKQGQGPPGQGPKSGQGPPGQGPPGQAPRQGQGPPGQGPPGQQAPKPGQGPPGQGTKQDGPPQQKGGTPQQGPKQQGPPGPGAHPGEPAKNGGPPGQQEAGKPAGGLCPLCKTTKLNTGSKDPPNYNNCTECKNQVCSLCGFSPPDSEGKEWLCLNCQMQRAMGGMDPPGMTKPKQGSAPPSPQRQAPGKPGKLLIKQQSTTDHGLTPPTTPRQKSPGPTSPGPLSPGVGGSPKIDPKTGRPIQPKSSPQQSPAKAKQESSFFGGFSLGGLTDSAKPPAAAPQASESVKGKLFSGFGGLMESSKPQAQAASKQEESVAGKLFGGFGGLTESAKPPAAASQMFSFGSTLLSSATNIVSGEDEKKSDSQSASDSLMDSGPGSPPDSDPGSAPDSPFSPPGSPPDSESAPDTPPAKITKPPRTMSVEQEENVPAAQPAPATTSTTKESCPLCNVELNAGSADMPNYSLCTECKKNVCNLCGFNPTPHLGEKEWLCLNCQTQRAMSGQLGDMPPPAMASPKKQPPTPDPSSTPAPAAVDSKPVVEAVDPTPPEPEAKVKTVETLKESGEKEMTAKEGSPTSPSDLAKLESTVLPILEAQASTQPKDEEKLTDTLKTRRKLEVLPLSPDSPSSEDDRELSEKNTKVTTKKKLLVPMDVRADSLDDSSESFGKESPMSGDDEEFIRKQIMEMSENEDASPSDEENLIRRKIREEEKKKMEQTKTDSVERSSSGKARRLIKRSTISPDDDEEKQLRSSLDKPDIDKEEVQELKEEEGQTGTAVRKFQTMELNATSSPMRIPNDDGEMESLTDSPDDRSRGDGSSSLHASSFTPGTSPTSLSSLDEDSDSSPGQIRSGEGKQHRKAKHRQPGQMLPTIEDSSEEEELREEEELLREQEKQKGSGKKSKKDKEEIRAQRRRERPKTPPSNLSPIEDASPTEELRQEAEMEEIRRSSCSDFSPSIESDPEGFEIHASKIAAVQKTYQLPISVSLHSPTDDQNTDKQKKTLKSADEAYEEIMLRATSPTVDKGEIQPGKESLYGGMLIEDYAYASLIDNTTPGVGDQEKIVVPAQPKKLRSPDEVYEDMLKKRKEFIQLEQEYQNMHPKKESTNPEIVLQPAENTFSKSSTVTIGKDGKQLLDAETAYEELMKKVLTPGTSPTQQEPGMEPTASRRALHPIPDLKVTQCSSGELSSDDESMSKRGEEATPVSDTASAMETEPVAALSESPPSSTSDQQPHTTTAASQAEVVDLSSALPRTSAHVIDSTSPLPTVPQYTPSIPSVVSTAPPVPPKPSVPRRANSQEKAEVPAAPPLPPPTPPKPTVFPRKPPVPLPSQASAAPIRSETVAMPAAQGSPTRQPVTPMYRPHVPPPVPPKPSIPAGIGDSRPGHGVKPPIAPKPGSQPSSPAHVPYPPRPTVLPTGPTDIALNLSPSSERSCATQQATTPLPEDRFGYRDDHYQYDRSPYGMRGFGGIKPSMSDTNLAEAGLFFYKSKNSYNFSGTTEGAVDLTSAKISDAGEAVDYSKKGTYAGMTIPPYSQARVTSAVGTLFGTSSVLRSSNGVVYSSVAAPIPSTYAITTQPGSIFSTTFNTLSGMHTSDTMPSLSNLQNVPLTRSHSFLSTISITATEEEGDAPLNLEISREGTTTAQTGTRTTTSLSLDTYTDASLEAIAASLEALSSPMVPGDGQYQAERERLEMEKLKQQRLAEELEWERQEIQRFREQEQLLVQKELEELQAMKQHILTQQEEERQAHLMMQKETYAQQQQQLEQIQRLQEQLRLQLEEQKLRQMYPGGDIPGHGLQEAIVLGPDGTVLARKITDSGCQTDEEDETVSKAYTAGRKKRSAKKSVDSCVQTDDEDQEEWEAQTRSRQSRPRTARGDRGGQSEVSLQAHTEISIQTDTDGNIRMDTRLELSDSERTSPKKRPTPLEIGQSANLKVDSSTLQAPPKSPKVLYSPISPCISPSKSLEFVSYEKSLGDTSPQKLRGSEDPSKASPGSPRGPKAMQRSMSDPKPMSPTGEERATSGTQYGDSYTGKGSGGTPTGTQKKVKRTLPNPPSEDESTTTGQTAYSTGSARRRMCRNSNMARAKILQDIDRELDLVERESSKLRKRQAELDEEEKEIDAKLRYLEMGINRRKDVLLKEREKRERAYLQSVAEDRDYMSDSEVSNIRETRGGRGGGEDEEIEEHGLERPRTAPQSELDDFVPPQTKHEYGKYSQYQYPQNQYQQSLYQSPQSYQSHSIYSSVPSLTSSQQQSYHQMLLLQQKAARQAALLSELDATKYEVISRQPDPTSSAYMGVKYDKYGNHLDLRALDVGSIARSPMSAVSDSYYTDVDHHTPRSYMLLEDAAELAKGSTGLSSSYSLAERELAKAEKLLRRSAADLGSTDYLGSTSRLHTFGKTPDEEDTMEEPYELKLLKQQLKQEFRRSTGTDNLEQLTGLSQHYYTPSSSISSYSQRHYPKTDKYSISRLTLEKQAAKQLPASMLYQKHKTPLLDPKISSKYSSITDNRGLETDYTSYLGSTSPSPRSRLSQDEITFGLRKNIAEQQKYLGSTLGANLAGSLNLGQSLGLDSAYPSGSRSRPSSRPTSCYGLDLSIKRDPSSSSLRLKGDGEASGDVPSYQTPSGRTKPTSLPIVQSGRGRIPIVAQNSEEESPLSPVGQPMGMARASAGPLPPISADSRDQFGSCLSLQDTQQQQHIREEPTRGRGYVLLDDLQGTMSDSEAYHLRREETDWFDKPRDGRSENGHEKRQGKGPYYPFPHLRVKLQRDPKDRSVSGNGLGIRVVGGKEVPGCNGDIGAYVAKVLPGGAAEQTGKILEGMQVLEWNGVLLTGKTYEEVQGLVGQPCNEAEVCVRLDLNMLAESEGTDHLDFQENSKGDRPPRSPGVDPKQLAAELQKVSQQQAPTSTSSSGLPATTSATSSPGQPGSPSTAEGTKTQSHPISGEIQLQIHYDKQLGNLIVHVLQARNLVPRDNNGYSDPFVKVYLLPGRGAENKRRSKHAGKSLNPEWNQTVIYKNILLEQVLIDLSNTAQLDNVPRWLPLKEQSEGDHHRRSHSSQGRHSTSKPSSQHSSPKTTGSSHDNQDSPKSSVIKSRSHGIFPDPAKDTQVPTIEKSHSSPGTSKPSPSEGQSHSHGHSQHSRSHGASRSSKSAARQHHQEGGSGSGRGVAIATGDAQQQQHPQPQQRLQPSHRGRLSLRHQRHSVVGVLTIQRAQSDWLPALPSIVSAKGSRADGRHLTLRKAVSEERPQSIGARSSYRSSDAPVTAASLDSGLSGSAYSLLDEEGETNEVDSAIFQVPRFGKIPNGTDVMKSSMGHGDIEGKSQVMGEIKIALKKEIKTEGENLVLEILQCRNITYKFKSPDHLPDLYVKLYVVNIATQKRIIKKKTRVCRHDREPSFNETFRFCMNPTGHSLQLFLVSNGGKFVKKTLIGEAYVWLDKVDLRKRVVSWHKLVASTAQIHS